MEPRVSWHYGVVRFRLDSATPYPYMACYCSICKTADGGGYAINLGGDSTSLEVEGEENVTAFQTRLRNPEDPEERVARWPHLACLVSP